jgi:hypothetical protein
VEHGVSRALSITVSSKVLAHAPTLD